MLKDCLVGALIKKAAASSPNTPCCHDSVLSGTHRSLQPRLPPAWAQFSITGSGHSSWGPGRTQRHSSSELIHLMGSLVTQLSCELGTSLSAFVCVELCVVSTVPPPPLLLQPPPQCTGVRTANSPMQRSVALLSPTVVKQSHLVATLVVASLSNLSSK